MQKPDNESASVFECTPLSGFELNLSDYPTRNV